MTTMIWLLQYGEADGGETIIRLFTTHAAAQAALRKHLADFDLDPQPLHDYGILETDEGDLCWSVWCRELEGEARPHVGCGV
jgi:hypothetical protein